MASATNQTTIVTGGNRAVLGGGGVLTVFDAAGSNTIGGLGLMATGAGETITTVAGAAQTIANANASAITSCSDLITLSDQSSTMVATGAALINSAALYGVGTATVGSHARLALNLRGASFKTIKASGGGVLGRGAGVMSMASSGTTPLTLKALGTVFAYTTPNHTVTGGATLLTVTDSFGSNTLIGGSGGLAASVSGNYEVIVTAAGAADTITAADRSVIQSNGRDLINLTSAYTAVTASGQATINGPGFNSYQLNGAELLNAGGGVATIGAGGNATLNLTGGMLIAKQAGGTVAIGNAIGAYGSAATISGGAASISANGYEAITEGGGADTVAFGGGTTSVAGGSGPDTYVFTAGNGGQDVITGFKNGVDTLTFNGFGAIAVQGVPTTSTGTSGGVTQFTLNDGTTVSIATTDGAAPTLPYSPPTLAAYATPGHVVTGGALLLTVSDTFGSNTIIGGSGGIAASVSGSYETIVTAAGAADTINAAADRSLIQSNGSDLINLSNLYTDVVASGQATINSIGFNVFQLNGLEIANIQQGAATIGATGDATVNVNGGYAAIVKQAGGSVVVGEVNGSAASLATIAGGGNATILANGAGGESITTGGGSQVTLGDGSISVLSGGGDTIATGYATCVITEGGGADTVAFGGGTTSVAGGSGPDTYVFTAGNGGQDVITGFKNGVDTLTFNGFGAIAVQGVPTTSTGTSGGVTQFTLNDGTTVSIATTDGAAPTLPGTGGSPTVAGGGSTVAGGGPTVGGGEVLTVGPGCEFASLSDAIAAAGDNSVIEVAAGTYVDTSSYAERNIINGSNITIEGIGGMVHFEMGAQGLANGKALLVVEHGLTLKNFELSGATNGQDTDNLAGIRLEGGNLTVQDCYIHDNADGILGGVAGTSVVIDQSEFARNGAADGHSHNIYIGPVDSFTMTNSYSHDANTGHEVKSRATVTVLQNNVFADSATGTASYDIDLPNGGAATISGNIIEKGPDASNYAMIHYGGEGQFSYGFNSLSVTGNTFVNDAVAKTYVYGGAIDNPAAVVGVFDQLALTTGTTGTVVTPVISGNSTYNLPSATQLSGWSDDPSYHTSHSVDVSGQNNDLTQAPVVPDTSPWALAPVVTAYTGPLVLTLTYSGHTVTGGASLLTVTDSFGSNLVSGGSGGLNINTAAVNYEIIATAAGAASTVVAGGHSAVASAGSDAVTLTGDYTAVIATGAATISSGLFDSYQLNGPELILASRGIATIGATGAVTVGAGGSPMMVKQAGGSLVIGSTPGTETAAISGGVATVWATATGNTVITDSAGCGVVSLFGGANLVTSNGADVITAGSGQVQVTATGAAQILGGSGSLVVTGAASGLGVTAASGNTTLYGSSGGDRFTAGSGQSLVVEGSGADTVTFGAGQATVTSGSGGDLYIFTAGAHAGATVVINNFDNATDRVAFSGFSGAAMLGQSVAGGSTMVTLSDGTHIQFTGLTSVTGF